MPQQTSFLCHASMSNIHQEAAHGGVLLPALELPKKNLLRKKILLTFPTCMLNFKALHEAGNNSA